MEPIVEARSGRCPGTPGDADATGVDSRPEPSEHGWQQRQRGGQDGDDRQHDAEGHGTKCGARHEQDGGQGSEHGEGAEGDGLAGGVHRLGHRGDDAGAVAWLDSSPLQGGSEAHDEEQRVVDPESEGEHQGEVERPDGHRGHVRREDECAGRDEQPHHGEHEGEPGGHQAAERDDQDDHRHRPREHLRAKHGAAIGRVEVGPQRTVAGQGHRNAGSGEPAEGSGQGVGGADHGVGIRGGTGGDDTGPAVRRQRDARLGCDDGGYPGVAVQELRDLGQDRLGGGVGGDRPVVVDDHHLECGGSQTGEVALDDGSGLDRLAGRVLPARTGQGVLDLRGEGAEDDQDGEPQEKHGPEVGRRPSTEPGHPPAALGCGGGCLNFLVGLGCNAELVRCHGRSSLGLGRAADEDQYEYTPRGICGEPENTVGGPDEMGRSRTASPPGAAPGIRATRRSGPACTWRPPRAGRRTSEGGSMPGSGSPGGSRRPPRPVRRR